MLVARSTARMDAEDSKTCRRPSIAAAIKQCDIMRKTAMRVYAGKDERAPVHNSGLIPTLADQNSCAQSRNPMDMMVHGCSASLFQA